MHPSLRPVLVNGRLKLAAVALALFLWISVSAEEQASQWLTVPVEVALLDPMQTLVQGPIPAQVEVRFTGPGRDLWELAITRPPLLLPVRDPDDDDQIFVLDPEMVRVPQSLEVAARDVRPSSVRLVLRRTVRREVPVRVRLAGELPEGLVWLQPPRPGPERVELVGTREQVNAVDTVYTRPFAVGPTDSAFSRMLPLDTAGLGEVALSSPRVRVAGRVDRVVARTFTAVPVAAPPGFRAEPASVDVRITGPRSRLLALRLGEMRVQPEPGALAGAIPVGGATVPLRVDGLPALLRGEISGPVRFRRLAPSRPAPLAPDTLTVDTLLRDGDAGETPR